MKIYTKTGDDSTTFHGGVRVSKTDLLIHCQGEIDELNSFIGLAGRMWHPPHSSWGEHVLTDYNQIQSEIETIQRKLFDIGAQLNNGEQRVTEGDIAFLEKSIDAMEVLLPELKNFILPDNFLHLARAVCRRAERSLSELKKTASSTNTELIVPYLNRLSDYLFVLARRFSLSLGQRDEIWDGKKRD